MHSQNLPAEYIYIYIYIYIYRFFDKIPRYQHQSPSLKLITFCSSKSSPMDFIPPLLIKSCNFVFSESITTLANLSISQDVFPSRFKAQITRLLKKPELDKDKPLNYRLISNLNISKILDRLLVNRVMHISLSSSFHHFQSAYRKYYSTETVILAL